jgi:hypothetical protein
MTDARLPARRFHTVCGALLASGALLILAAVLGDFVGHAAVGLVLSLIGAGIALFTAVLVIVVVPRVAVMLGIAPPLPAPQTVVVPVMKPVPTGGSGHDRALPTVLAATERSVETPAVASDVGNASTGTDARVAGPGVAANEPATKRGALARAELPAVRKAPLVETRGANPPGMPRAATAGRSEPEIAHVTGTLLAASLDTTLGEIIIAALRNDPEAAGRLFAAALAAGRSSPAGSRPPPREHVNTANGVCDAASALTRPQCVITGRDRGGTAEGPVSETDSQPQIALPPTPT